MSIGVSPSTSPWNVRVNEWLKENKENPFNGLLPPLVEIVLRYAYTETLLVLHGWLRNGTRYESSDYLSFCPSLDKAWLVWKRGSTATLPSLFSSLTRTISDTNLVVRSGNADGLFTMEKVPSPLACHHCTIVRPSPWQLHKRIPDIQQVVILEERSYFLADSVFVSASAGTLESGEEVMEYKNLTPPPPTYMDRTILSIRSNLGSSFEHDMDTTVSGVILIVGSQSTFGFYNPVKDRWRSLPDLPRQRMKPLCMLVQDQIWFLGGSDNKGKQIVEIDCYSLTTHQWSILPRQLPPLPGKFEDCPLYYANQQIYAFPQTPSSYFWQGCIEVCFSLEILDPHATWIEEPSLDRSIDYVIVCSY